MKGRFRLRLTQAGASAAIVLVLAFVCRWLLSGRNSYWLDELLSVVSYGIDNRSGLAAIQRLAHVSIHPPLYQLILFYWMRLFGDDEVSTRFLSNLYVSGAAFCLYQMVREAAGRRRALMALIFFSFLYGPFYYALETRSYAQSLMFSALSSMALFRFMRVFARSSTWKERLVNRACALLVAANLGLLLTHYYNIFFLTSQGLFVLGWVAWRARATRDHKPAALVANFVTAAAPLIMPLVLLLLIWGPVMARSYHAHRGSNVVRGSVQSPFSAFMVHSMSKNFLAHEPWVAFSAALLVVCGVLLVAFYAEQTSAALRDRSERCASKRALAFYSLVMAFVPYVVSSSLFALSGHERYADRYFIFTTPSLALLIVFAVEQAVSLVDRLLRRRRAARAYIGHSAFFTLLAAALLVLPGTYEAATRTKANWRGICEQIADITREDPDHKYLLYATSFSSTTRLEYYLARAHSRVKVRGAIAPRHERRFSRSPFARESKAIARADFIILTFTHLDVSRFKKTIAALDALYERHIRLLNADGLGLIIYRVKKPD